MRWLDKLRMRTEMLFQRGRAAGRLDDELRFHLDQQIAENLAAGMSEDEARHAALREFGNPAALRDQARETWSWNVVESALRDVRIGARTLLRAPGFAVIAVGVMALCIGAATSLFTVTRSVLLRPLPFRDPERLVMIYEHFRDPASNAQGFNYNSVAPADYYDWRARTRGFEDMAAWRYWQFNLTGEHGELPELVGARGGSWNLFPLLGVRAALGRTFTESEDRTDGNAVMLTWSIFERRFGGDPSMVGRQIHLDGKPYTVVGVLPKWFTYPDAKVQLWVPYESGLPPEIVSHHDYHFTRVVARLRSGVSLTSALSQVEAVQYQEHLQNLHAPVAEDVASKTLIQDLAQDVKKPLVILLCAVACMLLIGCLNVANLMVARSAARQKEIAIRSALGARRITLIREQLIESLLVSTAGGAAGVLLSLAATKWLATTWTDLPSARNIYGDGTVLAFACALTFAAALLAGLLPAISSTGKGAIASLQASSRSAAGSQSRTALRKLLLTVEIATTVVLLIAAGLLLKSFVRLRMTDVGCATENVLTMSYSLPAKAYDSPEKVNAFNETLLKQVRVMPGVRAVALGSMMPGVGAGEDNVFSIHEHPPIAPGTPSPDALYRTADPEYFSALQIPLLKGRFFTSNDRAGRPKTVIISRLLAQQYFPGEDPLGKHLHVVPYGNADYEIVGVVADTLYQVGQPAMPTMYFPVLNGRGDVRGFTLAVRTASDPLAFSIPIQKQIAALDPELPVSDVLTMQQILERSLGNASLSASLVLAFALLSLMLASVGLYGVLSYLTTQRTGEIGVRMALGAERGQVLRLVLGDGLRPALYGLVLGLATSAGAVRLIESMLYGTKPLDPAIFAAVAATLLVVAAMACMVPAWRASRIDPMQALRTE
ncbi:MAG: ABC transporter permease [Silvibacterium sp.]|nr:ABC transporter permease [Silvibacterium sp.]MBV8437828.1 ABC transporter permease [Silvibacterium sp.]